MAADRWNSYEEIFSIIIDDRSVGSIRLFPMIDYEILADSQHYHKLVLALGIGMAHNHHVND